MIIVILVAAYLVISSLVFVRILDLIDADKNAMLFDLVKKIFPELFWFMLIVLCLSWPFILIHRFGKFLDNKLGSLESEEEE